MGLWKEMRAEVAVYTKWSNEEDVWPAKKGFVLNIFYQERRANGSHEMSDEERKGQYVESFVKKRKLDASRGRRRRRQRGF